MHSDNAPSGGRLLIGCYFPRAVSLEGVGTFVTALAGGMVRLGWQVSVLWPGHEETLPDAIRQIAYQPGTTGFLRYLAALRRAAGDVDTVMLVENNPNMGFTAQWVPPGIETYVYFNTPLQSLGTLGKMHWSRQAATHTACKHWFWSSLSRWSDRRCLVSSQFQADQLRTLGAVNVGMIPGGGPSAVVPLPNRAAARQMFGWDNRPVVGYLGHYSPAKGVGHLLEAMLRCDRRTVLALAYSGKGKLFRKDRRSLNLLRGAGRVRELGVVDPIEFLAACDLICLPFATSSIQHLPLVLTESFAAGTAVLSTRVGGVPEFIDPGTTGDLAAPRNAHELSRVIESHLKDREHCHHMGRRAREFFEQQLCNEVFCQRLSDALMAGTSPMQQRTAA